MSIANINNGETGLSARGKINQSIDIVNLGVVTGATLNVSTLEFNTNNTADAFNVDLSALPTVDNFTTGATLVGNVIVFDRTDASSAYTVDLTSVLIAGTSGTSGIDGTSGTSGVDGTSGINGTSGVDGTSGINGTSGVDGTSGINGTSGVDGTGGTSGVDGTSGINGTNTFTTGGTYNSVTEEIDFFGNSPETTFSVDVSGLTPFNVGCFGVTIDGAGSVITTGVKGTLIVPYDCTIDCWGIVADQSGSTVVDVWKGSSPLTIPTSASDSIAGTEKPTLSSEQINTDLTLTSWTTSLVFGDVLVFNVDSASTVTRVTIQIKVIKI